MSYVTGDSLGVRIRIAFGANPTADPNTWTWTDVTDWWHVPDAVDIGWGRSSGAEQAETATMTLTLKNTDGRFTSYDPRSPYWPNVQKWTPVQYDIDLGDGAGWRNRFSGYIRKWPLTWPGRSSLMALAKLEAVGVLGRLGRGKPAARSPMRRSITGSGPVAYWPCEDGGDATLAASAMPGHPPMTVSGTVAFEQVQDMILSPGGQLDYGTLPLANLDQGGSLTVTLPGDATAAASAAWAVQFAAETGTGAASGDVVVLEWTTPGGTYTRWQLVLTKATISTQVIAYTAAGAATIVINLNGAYASFLERRITAEQSGANIIVRLYESSDTATATATLTSATLAAPQQVTANATGTTNGDRFPFGHLAVWGTATPAYQMGYSGDSYGGLVWNSARAYDGETAHDRLARLCAEDGIPIDMPAVTADGVVRMGRQPVGAPLDLYQQCEAADQGILYEAGFGLGYLPRAARYNAPVALTIDAALGQLGTPFEPVDDDVSLRNKWTVARSGGSSAVAVDQASIDGQGEIEASVEVGLAADDVLADHAAWRLHLTTVPEPRYPAVSIDLGAHPELAAAWCDCAEGSRINVVNPPPQNVPGTVDQLVVGARETYRGRRAWKATLNVAPASPWQVAEADGDQRVAADGSTLAADITSTATSLLLASTTENRVWTTDPADFPLDIRVGGERVTLSAISGSTSPQTATISARGVNGFTRTWPAGTEVDVWEPAIVAL